MKVLQINSVCGVGSTGRIAVNLYQMLEQDGHTCCIAYGRGSAPNTINTIKIGGKLDVYFHGLMSRITDRQGFYSQNATKELIKKAKMFNPDIIHLHNLHGYYINIELLFDYLKDIKKPVIWTLHDCWAFTGHCAHFESVECDRWKTHCYECQQSHEYPRSYLFDASKKNYQIKKKLFTSLPIYIITPSAWMQNIVHDSFLKANGIYNIPNGIDTRVFNRKLYKKEVLYKYKKLFPEGKIIILGVASVWTKKKGLNDFIRLNKLLDHTLYQIILVGVSNKQKRQLPSNIIGIEHTDSIEELALFYTNSDVFLNLTYEDTYPTTNLEALACGTPVITYQTGGSTEISNFSVKCGDLNAIKELLLSKSYKNVSHVCLPPILDQMDSAKMYLKLYIEKNGERNEVKSTSSQYI